MRTQELLEEIAGRGVTLRCDRAGDRLEFRPASALSPELVEKLREHKGEVLQVMREDEELRRSGIIQSERQVFELARRHFRPEERDLDPPLPPPSPGEDPLVHRDTEKGRFFEKRRNVAAKCEGSA